MQTNDEEGRPAGSLRLEKRDRLNRVVKGRHHDVLQFLPQGSLDQILEFRGYLNVIGQSSQRLKPRRIRLSGEEDLDRLRIVGPTLLQFA